ncbi:MAG: type 4 pilus major pilin [Betaproteobacteria bacterium]|nr:type 4 pilus major pilin [Betaproteobacteria bacterium]
MGLTVLFAVIVVVLMAGAAWKFGHSLFGKSDTTAVSQEIKAIASNVQGHYAQLGSFAGITTATEIANGDIESSYVTGGAVDTSYGGTIVVGGPASLNGGTDNAFGLTVNNMSQQDCIDLATTQAAYGINSGTTVGAGVNTANDPATDAEAGTICTAANGNELTFTYTLSD